MAKFWLAAKVTPPEAVSNPVTPKVPAMEVFPELSVTVNLLVFIAKVVPSSVSSELVNNPDVLLHLVMVLAVPVPVATAVPFWVIVPEQAKFPFELVIVQPVDPDPPAILTSPVDTPAILTAPDVPASKAKAEVPPAATDPAPAKVKAVDEVVIVSMDATPVNAPPVVTFRPPLEVKENVPEELPIAVLDVPEVLMEAVPPEMVKPAEPVNNPATVKASSVFRVSAAER